MSTLFATIWLVISQYRKQKGQARLSPAGNLLYYLFALGGLALAAAIDLDIPAETPVNWFIKWFQPVLAPMMRKE